MKKTNALGLCDMHGGVREWCEDRYDADYYFDSPLVDPRAREAGRFRVLRGGSWFRYAGNWQWCWQRDFFDHHNTGIVFMELLQQGKLSQAMQERLSKGSRMPGWVKRGTFDWYATIADREDGSSE